MMLIKASLCQFSPEHCQNNNNNNNSWVLSIQLLNSFLISCPCLAHRGFKFPERSLTGPGTPWMLMPGAAS